MGLSDEIIAGAENDIRKRILPSLVPQDDKERERFYACLTPLINDAWNRSWRNMRHEMNRKKQGKAQKSKPSFK